MILRSLLLPMLRGDDYIPPAVPTVPPTVPSTALLLEDATTGLLLEDGATAFLIAGGGLVPHPGYVLLLEDLSTGLLLEDGVTFLLLEGVFFVGTAAVVAPRATASGLATFIPPITPPEPSHTIGYVTSVELYFGS